MIIIFDTETTGLTPKSTLVPLEHWPRIIEVACVVCEGATIVETYSQLVQPGCPIPEKITKITGLTAEDLIGMPEFEEILPNLRELFGQCGMGIAHNLEFDCDMINSEVRRTKTGVFPWPKQLVCTVQQYAHLKGKWLKQEQLYEHFMGRPPAKAHRALDDVLALHECLVAAKFFEEVYGDNQGAVQPTQNVVD